MARPVKHGSGWRIRWLDANGERQSATFKRKTDAAAAQQRYEVEAQQIRAGLRARPLPERTFDDLADLWLEKRAALKRSGKDDHSIIRRHLRPVFGAMSLATLSAAGDVLDDFGADLLDRVKPKTAANILTLLISMLNFAVEREWIVKVAKIRKPPIRLFDTDFRYLRTEEEIRRFLVGAREEAEVVFVLYATAVYSGMRAGELAALFWDDMDLDRRLITVQRSFDGPTKTGDLRHVPILDPLLPVLREWRLRCPGRLVFPNERGKMHSDSSARIFQDVLHRVLDRSAFPTIHRDGEEVRYVTFHSLRHTFASHWMMAGGDIFKLQKILGHKSIQMTERYSHLAPAAFAADYARLGAHDLLRAPSAAVSISDRSAR